MTFQELCRAPSAELERLLRAGKAPALDSIVGHEWKGFNTPPFTALLGIRKFIKGFFRVDARAEVEGYNIPARQNGADGPWLQRPSAEAPKRFGFYRVRPVHRGGSDSLYPGSLLLDYGASPRNAVWQVERLLRDYMVQPDPSNPDVLLGKAYLALGPARPAVSYFVLERLRRSDWLP